MLTTDEKMAVELSKDLARDLLKAREENKILRELLTQWVDVDRRAPFDAGNVMLRADSLRALARPVGT